LVSNGLIIGQNRKVATRFSRPVAPPIRASPFECLDLFLKKSSTPPDFHATIAPQPPPAPGSSCHRNLKRLPTVSSHLSSDIQIEGDLNCSTDLIFDGSIKGNITSKGSLTIGQNASVNGNLKAEKAVIEGKIVGNGDFNSCRLSPTSVISGSVNTVSLQMEEGASLEGQCKVGKARA
jgi:cytoskeletal protein CcmA (bactofilin family)